MGDTQRFYDDVEDFVARANQEDFDFVLMDGDISDFGINDEFSWIYDIMKHLKKPYVSVIGNHDLFRQWRKSIRATLRSAERYIHHQKLQVHTAEYQLA